MPINKAPLMFVPQMLLLIAEIDKFQGAGGDLETLAPDRLSALQTLYFR